MLPRQLSWHRIYFTGMKNRIMPTFELVQKNILYCPSKNIIYKAVMHKLILRQDILN